MPLSQNAKLGLLAGAIVGGGTLLLAFVVAVVLLTSGSKTTTPGGAATNETKKVSGKPWSREEFKKMVVGKSKDEIITMLGKPNITGGKEGVDEYFRYEEVTKNPYNDKLDLWSTVRFDRSGVAKEVDF